MTPTRHAPRPSARRASRREATRRMVLALLVVTPAMVSSTARGDDVQACLDAHEKSQVLRKQGKLLDTREQLLVCTRDVCPAMIRKECGPWLDQVNNSMPSISFAARKDGRDLVDVKVFMDGELMTSQLDGRAVDVDPGPHTFRFEAAGLKPVEMKAVVREGEKARELLADFGGNTTAPASSQGATPASPPGADTGGRRPIPMLTYVLGGVGIAALAGSTVFELRGLSKRSDLDSQNCKPYCDKTEVDSAKQSILIGDVALGVGVASLGAAAYFYFTRPVVHTDAPSARIEILPTTGGGMAGVGGTF
jgi:hypothetical protein